VLALCGSARGADTSGFDKANGLYEAGKYSDAQTAYSQLVQTGPWSANLFYNLGNAEWKLGNAGAAAADYESALMLDSSHPQARANLDFVRQQTGARLPSPTWRQEALQVLDTNTATILLAVCGWAALFCLAVILTRSGDRTGPVVTLTICLLAAAYAAGCLWEGTTLANRAVVVAKSADARVAPADVAPLADELPAGSEVLGPQERGGWTYCTLPDGTQAWVKSTDIQMVNRPKAS
jgi:tetratricopeptide (TPR) repeat protein